MSRSLHLIILCAVITGCARPNPLFADEADGTESEDDGAETGDGLGATSTIPGWTRGGGEGTGDGDHGSDSFEESSSDAGVSGTGGTDANDDDDDSESESEGGSSTGDPPTGTTGEPPSVYGDCNEDGEPLCPGVSCILDIELDASACAPDCNPGCPDGGICTDTITDQAVAAVCILVCTEDFQCDGGVCGNTGWTHGGAPLYACMWP